MKNTAKPTLKQLEALFWIVQAGSFERAAKRLHTSQSAISKRIQELEILSAEPIFDREARSARLTLHGRALFSIAEQILRLTGEASELLESNDLPSGRFRIGITEMTALTWLPSFMESLRLAYPRIDVEPEVDISERLVQLLRSDQVDLIIVPDAFPHDGFMVVPIGSVTMRWMASPRLAIPTRTLDYDELSGMNILIQGERSGSGRIFKRWLADHGISVKWKPVSDSLFTLVGLTISGYGLSYLPREAMDPQLRRGQLRIVEMRLELPPISYVAMYRKARQSSYETFVLAQAKTLCNFTSPIW